jgi:hypothetical protein
MPEDQEILPTLKDIFSTPQPSGTPYVKKTSGEVFPTHKHLQEVRGKTGEEKLSDGYVGPMASSVLHGASFGLSPYVLAKARSLTSDMSYEEAFKKEREQQAEFNQQNPAGHMVTEIGGGLLTGSELLNAGKWAFGKLAPKTVEALSGSGLLPLVGRYMAQVGTGAGMGATMAAADEDDPNKRASAAKQGALYGGAGTALLSPAIGAIFGTANYARKTLTPAIQSVFASAGLDNASNFAKRSLLNSIAKDGDTPETILLRLHELSVNGRKDVRIMDVLGPNATGLLKAAGNTSGPGKERMSSFLQDRLDEQSGRVSGDISELISNRTSHFNEVKKIGEELKAKAQPMWDKANAYGDITDPKLLDLFKKFDNNTNPDGRGGILGPLLESARKTAEASSKPFTAKLVSGANNSLHWEHVPSVQDVGYMRAHLNNLLTPIMKGGTRAGESARIGGAEVYPGALIDARNTLDKILDGATNGEHKLARDLYSGSKAMEDQLNNGYKALKTHPDQVADEFSSLTSQSEREAYAAGLASALSDKTSAGLSDKALLKQVYGSPNARRKIETVIDDPVRAKELQKRMAAESQIAQQSHTILPAVKMEDLAGAGVGDINALSLLFKAGIGSYGGAANNAQRLIGSEIIRYLPGHAEAVANLGMHKPGEAAKFFAQNKPGAVKRALTGGLTAVGNRYNNARTLLAPELATVLTEKRDKPDTP